MNEWMWILNFHESNGTSLETAIVSFLVILSTAFDITSLLSAFLLWTLVVFWISEKAFGDDGELKQPKELSINKVGHGIFFQHVYYKILVFSGN